MISLQRSFFESSNTNVREVLVNLTSTLLATANTARRGGLIVNLSKHDLLIWFGTKPPLERDKWLVIPQKANCDIPIFFVGDIYGVWKGIDDKQAKIYEFYGD
jgi:hypothetical protein